MATPLIGFFISFTEDEEKAVMEFLTELEYTPDKDGLKKFIMDEVEGEEGDEGETPVTDHLKKFMKENPEIVAQGTAGLGRLFKKIVTKI